VPGQDQEAALRLTVIVRRVLERSPAASAGVVVVFVAPALVDLAGVIRV
jgi:hypothetical protein